MGNYFWREDLYDTQGKIQGSIQKGANGKGGKGAKKSGGNMVWRAHEMGFSVVCRLLLWLLLWYVQGEVSPEV